MADDVTNQPPWTGISTRRGGFRGRTRFIEAWGAAPGRGVLTLTWRPGKGDAIAPEQKTTNFQLTAVQKALLQTTVIEKA
jgi:hypothetical protein